MTAAYEVNAERENQSILRKNGNNTSIYASIDLTSPFLERIFVNAYILILKKYKER